VRWEKRKGWHRAGLKSEEVIFNGKQKMDFCLGEQRGETTA
jgi:hypothetical protein